jgi:hypothetical protein
MKRREFFKTSAGLLVTPLALDLYHVNAWFSEKKKYAFEFYRKGETAVPVKKVTPSDGFYLHTFYDVCPFSPSQKYLAVTKLPFQNRDARFGDIAEICLIDLEEEAIKTVYKTKGWGFQLGANLEWGKTDRFLYTNDIINNEAVCVRIDLETGEIIAYKGPKYHLSPNEDTVIGFPLDLINTTQMGYGVPDYSPGKEIKGAPHDNGLWKTNLKTNEKKLLVSLEEASKSATDPGYLQGGNCYFFHSKFNSRGDKIMQVMRCLFPGNPQKKGRNASLLTFSGNGGNIKEIISREQWDYGGNHPNWHPNGNSIIMNIVPGWLGEKTMRFCKFDADGNNFEILSEKFSGSGHPSVTPDTKYLLSDYYVSKLKNKYNGEVPVRLIDLTTQTEVHICKIFTDMEYMKKNPVLRLDPHPVWSRDYKQVCFNGAPNGERSVFIARLDEIIVEKYG